jgi:hypothetical protein
MKQAAKLAVFVLCVAFCVAAVINVFGDNAEVEQMAKDKACEGIPIKPIPPTAPPSVKQGDCGMAMTRMSRTPFGQTFEYSGKSPTRSIRCTRSVILFGAYSCAVQ